MDLIELLRELHQSLLDMKACLEADKLAFAQNDIARVESGNAEKLLINQNIQNLMKQLQTKLDKKKPDETAFHTFILKQLNNRQIMTVWQAVQSVLFEIQNLIQINAHVLTTNQHHMMHIMNGLINISSSADQMLYQKTGALTFTT